MPSLSSCHLFTLSKKNEKDTRYAVTTKLLCCDLLESLLCIIIAKTLLFYIFRLRPSYLRKDNKAEGKKSNKENIIALLFNVWYSRTLTCLVNKHKVTKAALCIFS